MTSKHTERAHQQLAFFQRKEAALKRQRFEAPDNPVVVALKQTTLALYKIAGRISKKKVPHTVGDLIKPAAIGMVKTVFGEDMERNWKVSHSQITQHLGEAWTCLSLDIKQQDADHIKAKGTVWLQTFETS